MLCPIWCHLYNLKKGKNTHGGVLLLVKLQIESCNSIDRNTPPLVFLTCFKLYKWQQIAQSIANYVILQFMNSCFSSSSVNLQLVLKIFLLFKVCVSNVDFYEFRTMSNWMLEFEKWAPSVITLSYKVCFQLRSGSGIMFIAQFLTLTPTVITTLPPFVQRQWRLGVAPFSEIYYRQISCDILF